MLNGIRVVELATYVAAPGACALLADWGAEVIKVEPPAGDPHRGFFGFSGTDFDENRVFEVDNRGKRSITLDLTDADDMALFKDLVATADVLVTNTRPAALERQGLNWEVLRAIRPDLIFAQFTGYGPTGPEAHRPGFDMAAFWARSGLCSLTTVKGGEPPQLRTGIGDHVAALALTSGIMAALFHRQRTGEGQRIDASLLRTGVYVGGCEHAIQLQLGRLASPRPRHQAVNPLSNFFRTSEGKWFVLMPRTGGDSDWSRIAKAAGIEALVADERFASTRARRQNGAELVDLLDEAFGAMTWEQATAALDAGDVVFAPVQSVAETVADPQAQAAGCYVALDDEDGPLVPNGPVDFEAHKARPRRAPAINADGDAIRRELAAKG